MLIGYELMINTQVLPENASIKYLLIEEVKKTTQLHRINLKMRFIFIIIHMFDMEKCEHKSQVGFKQTNNLSDSSQIQM